MVRFNPDEASGTEAGDFRDYVTGGTNAPYIDQETTETGRVSGQPVMNNVNSQILSEMKSAAKKMGENPYFFEQIFEKYNNAFWKDADRDIFRYEAIIPDRNFREANIVASNSEEFSRNPQSYEMLLGYARWWYGSKIPGLAQHWGGSSKSGGGGGGGGGGGSRGPTAQDIRNQFDVDQLATRADDMFRAYLLDEAGDPRSIANDYISEMVRSRGEKKLDFDTFVLTNHIKNSPRYAAIYKNKPSDVSETDYIGRYHQMASSVLRPNEVAEVAIGGAQFGASPGAFEERLKRSNEYRTSAPFMQGIEARMQSVKDVFKG